MTSEDCFATSQEGLKFTPEGHLPLNALIALVVGAMVGAGIFTLPAQFAQTTGVLGALIAWVSTGFGMLMLAFVFQTLAQRKPDLDAGIFTYAWSGFGNYLGFLAVLAFWTGTCVINVSYFLLIQSTLGAFFPIFGNGNTIASVLTASIILWLFHFMILGGIKQAAGLNRIITIAKIVPVAVSILVLLFNFKLDVFSANWLLSQEYSKPLFSQVCSMMSITVYMFIGIEGASVYSRHAQKRSHIGIATLVGFGGVLCLLIAVTVLPFGLLPRAELAELHNPSVAGAMELMVGRWGSVFISVGLLVAALGAYLAWCLLAAEVPFMAAQNRLMPSFLTRENVNKVPSASLWMTSIVIQLFLIATQFSQEAFSTVLTLCGSMMLIPYLLVAAYGLKLALSGETYEWDSRSRRKEMAIAAVALVYSILMLFAGGIHKLLLSALILLPGTLLFFIARREQNQKVFQFWELVLFTVSAIAAITALVWLISGRLEV